MATVIEGEVPSCAVMAEEVRKIKRRLVDEGRDEREVSQMRFWYRGHAVFDWGLLPSGLRRPFDRDPGRLQTMLHEFRAEAAIIHDAPPNHDDARQWLFLMRHYEMPTLLIDWTRSPLAAIYFAVHGSSETAGQDAALWMVRPGVWNRYAIPASRDGGRDRLFEAYAKELNCLFQVHFYSDRLQGKDEMQKWIAAIEPVYNSRRMIAQQSVFTIHGPLSQPMETVHEGFDEPCLWRWHIPGDKKGDLQQELRDLGIQRSALFPDLDNLSRCVKARYEASFMSTNASGGNRQAEAKADKGAGSAPLDVTSSPEKKPGEHWTNNGSAPTPSDITAGGLEWGTQGSDPDSAQSDHDGFRGGEATGSSYVS